MGGESSLKPVINLGNSIVGVSILAIPYCFSQCGVLLGLCLVVFNALLTIWSCKMLIRAANMTRSHTYETLALAVLGKVGKLIIEISIIALNIGTCIAYFVIIGDLAPPVITKLTGIDISPATFRALLLVLSAIFIAFPLGLLRNVDSLSAVSVISLVFYFSLTVEVICLSVDNIKSGLWRSKFVYWNSAGLLKCLPIVSLAFACHTQMFVIYSSLHDPGVRKMSQITEQALYLILTLYLVVGLFGYITYCGEAEIKGDILAHFSADFISQLTRLGFAVSVVMSFPLMIFPCRASINSLFFSQAPNELHVQEPIPRNRFILITAAIVGFTVVIAILIPNIETVLGLTGATTGSLICFIFPGLLFLRVAGSSADFSNRAKLVLVIGLISMGLSTFVVLQAESTRSEGVEIPLNEDANKPDIIKLPPVLPGEEKEIDGKGVNDKIQDEGGGGIANGDNEDQRKEPNLPQDVVAKPKVEEDRAAAQPAKPEKPLEQVKPNNPGDDVVNIPPVGGEVKQKPAEPALPDPNRQEVHKEADVDQKQPQPHEVKDAAKQALEPGKKIEEREAVVEDRPKKDDKRDNQGGENVIKHDDHKLLEKNLKTLSNRVDQLEEENRELREKQEVIQRIQIQHGEDEQANVPPAAGGGGGDQVAAPKKVDQKDSHQDSIVAKKNPDSIAAATKPTVGHAKGVLDVDRQEKVILDALEKEDRVERDVNEQRERENKEAVAVEDVDKARVVPGAHGRDADQLVEQPRAAGVDGGGNREAVEAVVGDGARANKGGKAREEEEGRRDEGLDDGRVEMAAVHQLEEDELGDNAGNIAPALAAREDIGVAGGDEDVPQDSVKFRKRDLKNANYNGDILSR